MSNQANTCVYKLASKVDFICAMEIRRAVEEIICSCDSSCTIDFSAVEQSKSVILSLLLSWLRKAKQANKKITFINLNSQILDLIKICNLHSILSDYIQ